MRLIVAGLLAVLVGCTEIPEEQLGPWRTDAGEIVSVRASGDDGIRLRFYATGETRRFLREGKAWVAAAGIRPDRLDNARLTFLDGGFELAIDSGIMRGEMMGLPVRHAQVDAGGVSLHTRLMLPGGEGPFPAIVIAHGSGDDAATRTYGDGDFFAANGIAAVVYDKRGTGQSGGEYNHDFSLLADDLVAVVDWLGSQPGIDPARIGVSGYSQGGWIGPLAASRSAAIAFVIVNYGMINSPRDEERIETVETMARRGFSGEALPRVEAMSLAAIDIMASGFKDGWDEFNALARQYADEPWMEQLEGTTVGAFLKYPNWTVRWFGPLASPGGLDWDYDSLAALDELARRGIPSVWHIAAADRSAPNEFTLAELARRKERGEPVEVRVFENTDHGIVTFIEQDGRRRYGNYHPDYFKAQVDAAWRYHAARAGDTMP
jgi:uncharacterized protein